MERNYWVRTEHGRVWGPYTITALERLRGQLTEKCEASLDGVEWLPGADFPELRNLLVPARKVERPAAPPPPPPRISRVIAEAFGFEDVTVPVVPTAVTATDSEEAPAPAAPARAPAAAPAGATTAVPAAARPPAAAPAARPKPAPPPPPPAPAQLEVPESGDLAQLSPARLFALAALTSASGGLRLDLEKERTLRIVFRRGTPEHVSSDDPELSLTRFMQSKKLLTAEKALAAEEQAKAAGQDVLSVLFQQQLVPPADAARLLGEYSGFLLDRAFTSWRGRFTFEKDAPVPPGAFPLGAKWGLLADCVRRLDVTLVRARLGKRLLLPVVRSGGLGIGKVEELALNAQESRTYAGIDGTRTGDDLLRAHDPSATLRLLYLLTELGHLGFAGDGQESEAPPPQPKPAAPAKAPAPPPKAPAAAPPARELPKTVRDAPRPGTAARPAGPPGAKPAPPVMKATAAPVMQPVAAPKPAVAMRPPPTFAQAPADETPDAALVRLRALWERLSAANHFEVLGMERKSASAAETKRNFFVLAKELHPDTVTDPAQAELKEIKERIFARINEAAQVLGDEKRRKEYEAELDGKAETVDVSRIFAAEENFQRAEILIKARKYQEGLDLLEEAIGMNAEEAEFYAWRGYAKFLLAKDRKAAFEDCADDCRRAVKMVERCIPAHLFLGHMAKALGDLKLAKKCYTRVVELDEKHVEAQRELRLMGAKA